MKFRESNKIFDFFKCTFRYWGTIKPPQSERFNGDEEPYLDLGDTNSRIRTMYINTINTSAGFTTQVSGQSPELNYHLTTKEYVDNLVALSGGGGGSVISGVSSFSGLLDVSGNWTSGNWISFDGDYFIPSPIPAGVEGPQGPQGPEGPVGPSGATGETGAT